MSATSDRRSGACNRALGPAAPFAGCCSCRCFRRASRAYRSRRRSRWRSSRPSRRKPAPAPAARQLVAPPDQINDRVPEKPHFESDRDNTVEHETVNPGVPNPGPAAPPVQAPKPAVPQQASIPDRPRPAKPRQQQAERAAPPPRPVAQEPKRAPALDDLFASRDELVAAQRGSAAAPRAQTRMRARVGGSSRSRWRRSPPIGPFPARAARSTTSPTSSAARSRSSTPRRTSSPPSSAAWASASSST